MNRASLYCLSVLCLFTALNGAPTAARAASSADFRVYGLADHQPEDVKDYITRRVHCTQLADEVAYDDLRKKELAAKKADLTCDDLDDTEARLNRRYYDRPTVIEAIRRSRIPVY